MAASEEQFESVEGAAVFPFIPADLAAHPLLLAILHAIVFIDGSTEEVIDPDAVEETMQYLTSYLGRLAEDDRTLIANDLARLIGYARGQRWPQVQIEFLENFLTEFCNEGSH